MKLLLDENIPRKLKNHLSEFEVYTVREMNWDGIKNGELLKLMISEGFNVLVTADKNLQNQQNFNKYPIPVLTLKCKASHLSIYCRTSSRIEEIFDFRTF